MGYKKYLVFYKFNHNIFKNKDVKEKIINSSDLYDLTSFCSDCDVTSQMIYDLLDDIGIDMLYNSSNMLKKVNGIIACGKKISKLFDNILFLEMLVQVDDYYFYISPDDAPIFFDFVINKYPNKVLNIFKFLCEDAQLSVLKKCNMSSFYYKILCFCKKSSSEYILDRISSLNGYNYGELLSIFDKGIYIPNHLLGNELVKKISTMYSVRAYRQLINRLSCNNDVSAIENRRKKFYDYFLSNCVEIYGFIKQDFLNGVNPRLSIEGHLNCFGGFDPAFKMIFFDAKLDEILNKSLNCVTTDIVIDYLFHDITYNVFIDIKELIDFAHRTNVLSDKWLDFYTKVVSLDQMSIDDKISFLNMYKDSDVVSKFYDDYLNARGKMVELINGSILNSCSVSKFQNMELSKKYGVPIYELNGEDFYVFVRSVGKLKKNKLNYYDLNTLNDGVCYSVDGSNKLDIYCDPHLYFAVAYDEIPKDQLVHVFETDSFSNYRRDSNNLPINDNGTHRINRLYVPSDLVEIASCYNELIVAQPNGKDDEFNKTLTLPKPFAIYCYDEITDSDIMNAKANNLGIIVVRTKKYDICKSGRVSLYSRQHYEIDYYRENDDELRDRNL